MAVDRYLRDLIAQRNLLADNLNQKGVLADKTEKFNSLVPKVLEIKNSGIPQQKKSVTITENKITIVKPDAGKVLSEVEVHTNVPTGTNTSDATATADVLFKGETAYSKYGKITGNFDITPEIEEQANLIQEIQIALQEKIDNQTI